MRPPVLVLLVLCVAAPSWAAAPPPPLRSARLDRLVRQLDSDDWTVREQAERRLAGLDAKAIPELRRALADAPSAEVRRRLTRILGRLGPPEPRISKRGRELLDRIEKVRPGDKKAWRQTMEELLRLPARDRRSIREILPHMSDPDRRKTLRAILDYFDALQSAKPPGR